MPVTGGVAARALIHAHGDADDVPLDIPRVPAREAAERELSEPMYHENDPNLLQQALDTFWDWVGGVLDTASRATPGGLLGLVVVILLALAVVGALWWRLGTPHRTRLPSETLFGEGPRTAAEHRRTAEAHAAAGRWNQAVQERMRALVRSLEERALLDPRPGRTADEAADEAGRALPDHAGPLRSAARAFDDVTYGGRAADQAAYQRLADLDTAVGQARPQLTDAATGAP
ncbi:DUF4129 domain-containing protein [Streptomyces lichenis]|uniref:DUF4129 domain-containing protein n=1 Tax=Streptomyces lichenis TaxID=2306967 RepID=UPI00355672E6